MSQENVEIMRAGFEAWNAGDMDAFGKQYDSDVVLRTVEGWPEPGPYVGREAVMRLFEQNRMTWNANTVEPISDFIDGVDRVAVRMIWRGAGHGPGLNLEWTTICMMRKGKDRLPGVLLGSRRSPRNFGPVGARRSRRLLTFRPTGTIQREGCDGPLHDCLREAVRRCNSSRLGIGTPLHSSP